MVPSLISMLLAEFVLQINMMYSGQFGKEEMLAGIGMANLIINIVPYSLTNGFSGSVLETFVS
jgi:Na+-driven multidrug efflux pump